MNERTSRRAFLAAAAGGLAGLAGCGGQQTSTTTTSTQTTTASPDVAAPTKASQTAESVAWRWDFGVPLLRPAEVDGSLVVTTTFEGAVYTDQPMETYPKGAAASFDPASGERAWFENLPRPAMGPAFVHGGRLFQVGGWHGDTARVHEQVRAIGADGSVKWRVEGPENTTVDLLDVGDQGVFVGTRGGEYGDSGHQAFAFRRTNGSEAWKADAGDIGNGALAGDSLLTTRAGGRTHTTAFATSDGTRRWGADAKLLTDPYGNALTNGSVVALAAPDGSELYGRDVTTGERVWTYPGNTGSAAPSTDTLVLPFGSSVVALDPASGIERWSKDLGSPLRDTPVVGDQTVYAAVDGGATYALALSDGSEQWSAQSSGTRPVATAGESVVAHGSREGTGVLRSYASADGSVQWSYTADASLSLPTTVDGSVYAGSTGGAFLAFE
ncbi:PQQ-binding-like beta-propeller repeat protein [Halarchaeum sp. P4]|uniref:outer membrane protein assembly factor BamB family protein n=1 Tax=Halarchaeum sp. P4 TaxID=3421639 RepID=UPI003EBFBE0A